MVLQVAKPGTGRLLHRMLCLVQLGEEVDEDVRDRGAAAKGKPAAPGKPVQETELLGEEVNRGERERPCQRHDGVLQH